MTLLRLTVIETEKPETRRKRLKRNRGKSCTLQTVLDEFTARPEERTSSSPSSQELLKEVEDVDNTDVHKADAHDKGDEALMVKRFSLEIFLEHHFE